MSNNEHFLNPKPGFGACFGLTLSGGRICSALRVWVSGFVAEIWACEFRVWGLGFSA